MDLSVQTTAQEVKNDENEVPDHGETSFNLESTHKSPRKKKRHSVAKSRQSSVSGVLIGLEEDIFELGRSISVETDTTQNAILENNILERTFVQNKKGFEPASKNTFTNSLNDLSQNQESDKQRDLSPHEFAMYLYHKTRLFFSFCHGILGGFGIAHMSLVLSISDSPDAIRNFAEGYPDFARTVQILYYVLSAICFVSVLNRCDFAGLDLTQCSDFMKYRMADILSIIFYLGLLITSVVCVRWDDRLALSNHNEDLWKDPKVFQSEFIQWRIMSLLRGFFAVAGYIAMFFGPGDDLFYIHLYNMLKYDEKHSSNQENRY